MLEQPDSGSGFTNCVIDVKDESARPGWCWRKCVT